MKWLVSLCGPEESGVFRAPNRFWLIAGCIAVFGYAFFALQFRFWDQPFFNLMVLAFVVSVFYAPRAARTDPVVYLGLAALALGVFSYAQSNLLIPAYAEPHLYIAKAMAPFTLFLGAWWLGGSERNAMLALALGFAGIWAAILGHHGYGDFARALNGARVAFGFWNAEHTGVFFGTALIGWAVFSVRMLRPSENRAWNVGRTVLWALVFMVLAFCVIVAQARASWLGLGVAAVVGVVGMVLFAPSRSALAAPLGRVLLTMVFCAVVFVPVTRDAVAKRLGGEHDMVAQVGEKGIAHLPNSSMGVRIKLWNGALLSAAERPFTGWGYTARNHYIKDSPVIPESIRRFGHTHSSYLEVLLAYGIPGVLLYGALLVTVAVRAWRTWRAGHMPSDVMLFGTCVAAFFMVASAFETYIFGKTGHYIIILVGGVVYTFVLAAQQRGPVVSAESAR